MTMALCTTLAPRPRLSFRPTWLLLAVALAPMVPASAAGTAPTAGKTDAAPAEDPLKLAYREASAEYALGNFREALAKFEVAFRIKQLPALLFNIAQCHRQLRNFEQAATTYRSFIRLDPNSSQIELARELLKQVEEALRTQTRAQTAPPLDANGNDVVPKPAPELLAQHPFAPARPPEVAVPLAPPAEVKPPPAEVKPATALAAPPVNPVAVIDAQPVPVRRTNHVIAWSGGAVGVLAVGTGAIFAMQAKSAQSSLAAGDETRSAADGQISSVQNDSKLGNVLFIGGAVLLAGATIAWFVGAP